MFLIQKLYFCLSISNNVNIKLNQPHCLYHSISHTHTHTHSHTHTHTRTRTHTRARTRTHTQTHTHAPTHFIVVMSTADDPQYSVQLVWKIHITELKGLMETSPEKNANLYVVASECNPENRWNTSFVPIDISCGVCDSRLGGMSSSCGY